jgi:hypothetical protein
MGLGYILGDFFTNSSGHAVDHWRSVRRCLQQLKKSLSPNTPGTDVMIFKIFSPKIVAKKLEFLTQNKAKF